MIWFWKVIRLVNMNRNVLITGGAGFIGSNLSQRLSTKFDKVIIIDFQLNIYYILLIWIY